MRFLAVLSWLALAPAGAADLLPVIDAHSQFDDGIPAEKLIELAARAKVNRVLLAGRGRVRTDQVLGLGSAHPGCFVPSVRTKGRASLEEQFREPGFKAMGEIILVHAPKGRRAPQVIEAADSGPAKEAMRRAFERGWPVVLHYELRWLGRAFGEAERARRIAELKGLAAAHPQQVFALIHMAQLDPPDAAELIAAHPNLVFLTSHANTLATSESRQPWTDMFEGEALAAPWQALVLKHADRFVLALDNVWPEHWSERYVEQVALWRKALGKLPDEVAHAVAHGNAERLWKLPPTKAGEGCAALAR